MRLPADLVRVLRARVDRLVRSCQGGRSEAPLAPGWDPRRQGWEPGVEPKPVTLHPDPIGQGGVIPGEVLFPIRPQHLSEVDKTLYPLPWTLWEKGNGHVDVIDAKDRIFAHVYCWDDADWEALDALVRVE